MKIKEDIIAPIKRNSWRIFSIFFGIGFLWSVMFHSDYWGYVLRGIPRGNQGIFLLEHIACRTYIPDIAQNDEEFFKVWGKESVYGQGFTYNDDKFTIEEKCPVRFDLEKYSESESYKRHEEWMKTLDKNEYEIEKRKQTGLQEIMQKTNEFKKKFLNKEYDALKEMP